MDIKLISARNYSDTTYGGVQIGDKKYFDKELLNYMNNNWNIFDKSQDGIVDKKELQAVIDSKDTSDEAKASAYIMIKNSNYDDFVENRNNQTPNDRIVSKRDVSEATNDFNRGNTISKKGMGTIEGISQGGVGDCFFLSSINAMNQNPEGKQMLKNMIKPSADGKGYEVKFPGADKTYTVTKEELYASQENMKFSKGDTDVKVLELAANKAFKDKGHKNGIKEGGSESLALELLTGKQVEMKINCSGTKDTAITEKYLDSMAGDKITATVGFMEKDGIPVDKNTKDAGIHAYTITKIDKDKKTVTIHNPWYSDNKKDITMSYKEYIQKANEMTTVDYSKPPQPKKSVIIPWINQTTSSDKMFNDLSSLIK